MDGYVSTGRVITFITGVLPLVLTDFDIANDISNDKNFTHLYGFTADDVRCGLTKITPVLQPSTIEELLQIFERNDNGYRFHSQQEISLFNPTRTLFNLDKNQTLVREDPDGINLSGNSVIEMIVTDNNSKPAASTFELISKSSIARNIVTNALAGLIKCEGGITLKFILRELKNIKIDSIDTYRKRINKLIEKKMVATSN